MDPMGSMLLVHFEILNVQSLQVCEAQIHCSLR